MVRFRLSITFTGRKEGVNCRGIADMRASAIQTSMSAMDYHLYQPPGLVD